ncbi:Uncharacterised protein [Mycoplasmopsis bovigenitalium]|uniref:Uncharacterized protein n=1 Tax=Mycoplasmopsis bovigenitalium TaxID=2112 RepID=A0A449A8Z1_9BACT|nr:hypothetical protein [Mycoplasmopsis bovigenitalium]VEU60609.1 Uncharacterised protein [Mycoplasmopsis bovigenitalium]VEU60728.1 Uncharacterised protein [Mycoplasmopsis bovigenitalium]
MDKNLTKTIESGVWINLHIKDINLIKSDLDNIKNQFINLCKVNKFTYENLNITKLKSKVNISMKVDDVKYALQLALFLEKRLANKKIDIQQYVVQKWALNEKTK